MSLRHNLWIPRVLLFLHGLVYLSPVDKRGRFDLESWGYWPDSFIREFFIGAFRHAGRDEPTAIIAVGLYFCLFALMTALLWPNYWTQKSLTRPLSFKILLTFAWFGLMAALAGLGLAIYEQADAIAYFSITLSAFLGALLWYKPAGGDLHKTSKNSDFGDILDHKN